ncbi:hypothetical protein KI387_006125, partial [Taxus chinensis]
HQGAVRPKMPPGGPRSNGTSGTNVRGGRELASSAEKGNFSTGDNRAVGTQGTRKASSAEGRRKMAN